VARKNSPPLFYYHPPVRGCTHSGDARLTKYTFCTILPTAVRLFEIIKKTRLRPIGLWHGEGRIKMSRRKSKQEKLARARKILAGTKKTEISVKPLAQKIDKKQKEHRHLKSHMLGRGIGIIGFVTLVWLYYLLVL
jgi:hypothetical protein